MGEQAMAMALAVGGDVFAVRRPLVVGEAMGQRRVRLGGSEACVGVEARPSRPRRHDRRGSAACAARRHDSGDSRDGGLHSGKRDGGVACSFPARQQ